MKREHIIAFVQDPSRLDQSSLGELEELLETYPWFQTAHLLVAKNHHNIDSIKFHEVLRDSAAYAGDRTVLYHLINKPVEKTGAPWMEEPAADGFEKTTPQVEPDKVLPEPEPSTPELSTPEPSAPELATSGSASLEPSSPEPEEIIYSGAYKLEEEKPPSTSSSLEEYTFTGWFDHFHSVSAEKPALTEEEKLIDKFIQESPVISRGQDLPQSVKDLSGAGSLDSDSFMTETLARIYEKQGMLKKAIFAYEKLSLKYPEKSTYFATQINRLKSQLEKN